MNLYRSELSQPFIDTFTLKMGLTAEEFEHLIQYFRREYVPRKYFYLKAGEISKSKAYINVGSTRTFVMDDKGREHILFFAFEDWWVGDFESYYTQTPGKQYIQAMEDCEMLVISKTDLDQLCLEIPKLAEGFQAKAQKMIYSTLNRLSEVKTQTPEERYLNLIEKHPTIFQRIPLQYIAAYLDIEPPSLSRLRKRLSSK